MQTPIFVKTYADARKYFEDNILEEYAKKQLDEGEELTDTLKDIFFDNWFPNSNVFVEEKSDSEEMDSDYYDGVKGEMN
jgi:hypothetical protein